jgi:cytochrome c oxidase accessory protein FixG
MNSTPSSSPAGSAAVKPAAVQEIALYAPRKEIYARSVSGRYNSWRWALVWITQLVFYGLPWLSWNERPLVLFDLAARRFYIFGWVLYPQDIFYLTGILIISALSLFLFTAIAGRLWCGYACPQTVYTEIFMWVERKIEGDRSARMRLDKGPWNLEKIARKGGKQLVWIAIGLWTGFTFVGYFTPIRELGQAFVAWQLGNWETFWVFFYGFATYGNAGFMREQVCKYMCPYARFQSAMFDRDTMIVTYDAARGEPRGARTKATAGKPLGDCIDCGLCVQVCPTGIDIRRGLQYECIGCAACVDACNSVMDKVQRPRGLVRYTTENALEHGWDMATVLRRVLRPRVLIYGAILLALATALLTSLALRQPLRVDIVRDRAALARLAPGGKLENVYRMQIMNAAESLQQYRIEVGGLPGIELVSDPQVEVGPAASRWVAVRVQIPYGSAAPGSHPISLRVSAMPTGRVQVEEKSVFLVPR